jgi:hypothetical protein
VTPLVSTYVMLVIDATGASGRSIASSPQGNASNFRSQVWVMSARCVKDSTHCRAVRISVWISALSSSSRSEDAACVRERDRLDGRAGHQGQHRASYSMVICSSYQPAPWVNVSPTSEATTCRQSEHCGGTMRRPSTRASIAPNGTTPPAPFVKPLPHGNQPESIDGRAERRDDRPAVGFAGVAARDDVGASRRRRFRRRDGRPAREAFDDVRADQVVPEHPVDDQALAARGVAVPDFKRRVVDGRTTRPATATTLITCQPLPLRVISVYGGSPCATSCSCFSFACSEVCCEENSGVE